MDTKLVSLICKDYTWDNSSMTGCRSGVNYPLSFLISLFPPNVRDILYIHTHSLFSLSLNCFWLTEIEFRISIFFFFFISFSPFSFDQAVFINRSTVVYYTSIFCIKEGGIVDVIQIFNPLEKSKFDMNFVVLCGAICKDLYGQAWNCQ